MTMPNGRRPDRPQEARATKRTAVVVLPCGRQRFIRTREALARHQRRVVRARVDLLDGAAPMSPALFDALAGDLADALVASYQRDHGDQS